jgi:hypothetical protein
MQPVELRARTIVLVVMVALGPNQSLLVTRTRAVATDPASRKRFRRYWAPMSAGIIVIRYAGLPRMRKEAERRATHAGRPPTASRS